MDIAAETDKGQAVYSKRVLSGGHLWRHAVIPRSEKIPGRDDTSTRQAAIDPL